MECKSKVRIKPWVDTGYSFGEDIVGVVLPAFIHPSGSYALIPGDHIGVVLNNRELDNFVNGFDWCFIRNEIEVIKP